MADINTLVDDIQGLFSGHGFSEALERFSQDLGASFRKRFEEYAEERKPSLRGSNYGRPLRQLFYELKGFKPDSDLPPQAKFKFLYGTILEELLLLLAHEAGHSVTDFQKEVEVDGVVGHLDVIIDGVLVDVKSASTYSFQKFKNGSIRVDDPFAYQAQLAFYSKALGGIDGAFLVVDKTLGNIHLERFSAKELSFYPVQQKIAEDRKALESNVPPDKCYEDEPEGKSGNRKLGISCSYCSWKKTCWADANDGTGLREYTYARGPIFLTHVAKEPKVEQA